MAENAASRTWATKLFGPAPTTRQAGTAHGMAADGRWKRQTTGESIAETLREQRDSLVQALPTQPGPGDHQTLVGVDDEGFRGTCAAHGCRYLGAYRETVNAAAGDAKRHRTARRRSPAGGSGSNPSPAASDTVTDRDPRTAPSATPPTAQSANTSHLLRLLRARRRCVPLGVRFKARAR